MWMSSGLDGEQSVVLHCFYILCFDLGANVTEYPEEVRDRLDGMDTGVGCCERLAETDSTPGPPRVLLDAPQRRL